MGVFDRMGRVISSNFNAILDKADDPQKSIDLTLSEMEGQIRAARQEVVRGVAAEKQLRKKAEELDAQIEKWAKRAELAVSHDDDGLAREALTQKRRLTADRQRAEQLRVEQRGQALEMKAELERMEQKLEELRAKRGTLIARAGQARAGGGVESLGATPGGKPFGEFRRMEEQIEGVETAFAAQREVEEALGGGVGPGGMTRDQVEARFRELEHGGASSDVGPSGGDEIDDELQALKKRVRVKS